MKYPLSRYEHLQLEVYRSLDPWNDHEARVLFPVDVGHIYLMKRRIVNSFLACVNFHLTIIILASVFYRWPFDEGNATSVVDFVTPVKIQHKASVKLEPRSAPDASIAAQLVIQQQIQYMISAPADYGNRLQGALNSISTELHSLPQ